MYSRKIFFVDRNIFKQLNESFNNNVLTQILEKLNINDFKILGDGLHGTAILNKKNNKVYKFTKSINEFNIAKKQYVHQTKSLPIIYDYDTINEINFYIRDYFIPISDDFAEQIGEEYDEIDDFFYSNITDVRKSETNLTHVFNDKFLNFLNNLKKDLKKMGIGNNFDVDGIALNLYQDKSGNYILVDF